jgi:hypothetical protein
VVFIPILLVVLCAEQAEQLRHALRVLRLDPVVLRYAPGVLRLAHPQLRVKQQLRPREQTRPSRGNHNPNYGFRRDHGFFLKSRSVN